MSRMDGWVGGFSFWDGRSDGFLVFIFIFIRSGDRVISHLLISPFSPFAHYFLFSYFPISFHQFPFFLNVTRERLREHCHNHLSLFFFFPFFFYFSLKTLMLVFSPFVCVSHTEKNGF